MFDIIIEYIYWALGINNAILTPANMAVRAIVIYILTVTLVRLGKKRVLAKPSAFDVVLVLILGSVISRAITGNSPFFPTLVAAFTLIVLHGIFAYITYYSSYIGALVKGRPIILIKDGQIQWDKMRAVQLTERDLLSAVRRNAQILELSKVKLAILERNGEISVIPHAKKPEVVEIKVEDHVQNIKIEFKE